MLSGLTNCRNWQQTGSRRYTDATEACVCLFWAHGLEPWKKRLVLSIIANYWWVGKTCTNQREEACTNPREGSQPATLLFYISWKMRNCCISNIVPCCCWSFKNKAKNTHTKIWLKMEQRKRSSKWCDGYSTFTSNSCFLPPHRCDSDNNCTVCDRIGKWGWVGSIQISTAVLVPWQWSTYF